MSIKDLFNKKYKVSPTNNDKRSVKEDAESPLRAVVVRREQKKVNYRVDYTSASNFARYGLAEEYYVNAIDRITNQFPYDGSLLEKELFFANSRGLDKYIYDELYPKTTGYVILGSNNIAWSSKTKGYGVPVLKEYIEVRGGPHTASEGMDGKPLNTTFTGSNYYDEDIYNGGEDFGGSRTTNLKTYLSGGVTLEFWLKKDAWSTANTEKEVIFDLWNGHESSSADYGRLTLELSGTATSGESPFVLTCMSGTSGFSRQHIGSSITTSSITDWTHVAVSLLNEDASIRTMFYVNGDLNESKTVGSSVDDITGSINAYIGALRTAPSGNVYEAVDSTAANLWDGRGRLSASLDEFRFWKTQRSSKQIGRHWFTDYAGGTNRDSANATLGVYYKFNEGITNTSSMDSNVLDYSGRISNGLWYGYLAGSRNSGSAIVSASAGTEFEEPIIYENNQEVINLRSRLAASGSLWDDVNTSNIYNSFPYWIVEEDSLSDKNLRIFAQIMGSYFDTAMLQLDSLPKVHSKEYVSGSEKPRVFADRLLESVGLEVPDLFNDANLLNLVSSRDEERNYEQSIQEVKNLIYENIYNNIDSIYKSKGTMRAFRNMMHCFGFDEELININIYSNNTAYEFKESFNNIAVKKVYADFNDPDRYDSTIYQQTSSLEPDTVSYISGTNQVGYETELGMTAQAEVIFPHKYEKADLLWRATPFLTASIFGMHTANGDSPTDFTYVSPDVANFQVYAVRDEEESKDIRFLLSSSTPFPISELTSTTYRETYDGERWNLSVRVRPNKYPMTQDVTGSSTTTYAVEFHGVSMINGTPLNEFLLTASMSQAEGENFLKSGKRLYGGAHRQNFTASLVDYQNNAHDALTDVHIASVRYWSTYLEQDTINAHARDPGRYGVRNPYKSVHLTDNIHIPQSEMLALNWDFSQITSSDDGGIDGLGVAGSSNAGFFVKDISSGSATKRSRWDWIGGVTGNKHSARASYYIAGDTGSVNTNYIFSYRQNMPETVQSSDMVNILRDDDNQFTRESSPITHYFSFEKNMYRTISEEMLNMFATIVDFNNIIGEPVNRYRQEYKSMEKLRSLFFEKIQNEPSLDKYVDFYRWIDGAVSTLLLQLVPASAETSGEIRTMIESHLLERNKYWTKFPTLESKAGDPTAGIRGVNELLYDWEHGHKNPDGAERDNALYWRDRALRGDAPLSSSNADVNSNKETVRNISGKHRNDTPPTLYDTATATTYQGSAYAIDRFTKPYRLATHESREIKGGVNFPRNKKANLVYDAVRPHGPRSDGEQANIPLNVMLAQSSSVEAMPEISDRIDPLMKDSDAVVGPLKTPAVNEKRRFNFEVMQGRDFCVDYAGIAKDNLLFPFNIHSSSATGGYNEEITCGFYQGAELTNLHHDTYGEGHEVPMQGPFTEKWVGGHQSRHVELNVGSDNQMSRPEAFRIVTGDCKTGGFIGIVGADYPFPEGDCEVSGGFPVKKHPRASMYRSVTAKRPVNIAYIKQTGSAKGVTSIGNYEYIYQALQASSRATQRRAFVKTGGAALFISASAWVSGAVDYTRLDQVSNTSKHVFVERFSAPGGPETSGDANGGFGLDAVSGEYSPYNSLNNRNLLVRSTMRELFRAHTNAFGYSGYTNSLVTEVEANESDYSGRANYHKIHRNNLNRMTQQESYSPVYSGSVLINKKLVHFPNTDLDSGSCFALASYDVVDSEILTNSDTFMTKVWSAYSGSGFSFTGWLKPQDTAIPDGAMTIFAAGKANSNPVMWAEVDRNPNTADGIERVLFGLSSTTNGQGANGETMWEVKASSSFLNDWAHVAITWTSQPSGALGSSNQVEGEAMERAVTIYINGVSASSEFTVTRPFATRNCYLSTASMTSKLNYKAFGNLDYAGRRMFTIGGYHTDASNMWSGSMDELTFWKIPLDANQVTEIYNNGIPCDITASSLYSATGSNMLEWIRFEPQIGQCDLTIDPANPGIYSEGGNFLNNFTGTKFFPVCVSASLNNGYTASAEVQGCTRQFDYMHRSFSYITASVQDNYYVSHTIPRAEHQYSWLTASLLPNTEKFLGFAPADGMVTNSSGYVPALDFVSSSEAGTHYPGSNVANGRIFGNDHGEGKAGHLPTDFVGMNHNIYEPISSSANTVGYDSMTLIDHVGGNVAGYNNYLNVSHVVRNTFGGENVFSSGSAGGDRNAMVFNGLLLHRNGPYGYPSWKQIRTGEHAVARYNRRNNIISTYEAPTDYTTDDGRVFTDTIRPSSFVNYEEPPVGSSQYPILASLMGNIIQTTYGTNLVYFNNATLNERLGLSITDDMENQSYTNLIAMYGAGPSTFQSSMPAYHNYGLVYREQVYPKDRYAFTSGVRKRENFYVSFWTPLDEDRRQTHRIDSQGQTTRTGSIWGMDGPSDTYWNSMRLPREYDGGSTTTYLAGEIYSTYRNSSGSGELQDITKQLWGNYDSAGTQYTYKRGGPLYYYFNTHYTASANLSPSNGFSEAQLEKWGFKYTDTSLAITPIFGGYTKFEAHIQAGRAPFYKSYDEYVQDLRLRAKDHTIVPEFRISEHMPFYMLENGGYFIAENSGSLSLTGSAISSSTEDGFYRTYAHAEFMRHFDKIESDHDFDGGVRGLTLKCKAQMKLLPYDGFFPMDRTIQLASLFSQSYGSNIVDSPQFRSASATQWREYGKAEHAQAQKDRWSIWSRPFMAPGILYNTIKSGMAVDYPIMTGSWNKKFKGMSGDFKISASYEWPHTGSTFQIHSINFMEKYDAAVGYRYNMGTSDNITGSFISRGYGSYDLTAISGAVVQMDNYNMRLPFEAIIDPSEYVRGLPIADCGHTSSQPGFGVQDGNPFARRGMLGASSKPLYKMAMSNFLANVPEFFLNGKNFSTITSTTEDKFLAAKPGKVYGALVRLRKSVDTASTASHGFHPDSLDRMMAVNPSNTEEWVPEQSKEVVPWTEHKETMTMYSRPTAFGPAHGWGSFAGYNTPFTPSYYDGEGWAVLYWTPPTGSGMGKMDKLSAKKYSLDEIMANLDIMYLRHAPILNSTRMHSLSESAGTGFGGHGWMASDMSLYSNQTILTNADLERLGLSSEIGKDIAEGEGTYTKNANNYYYPRPTTGSYLYDPESNAMQVSASLNLTLKAGVASPTYDPETGQMTSAQFDQNSDTKVWAIQAKFETPMLNFKDVDASMPTSYKGTDWGSDPLDAPPSSSVAKGMWHQYGRLPAEDEGIYMQIGDIPEMCKSAWAFGHVDANVPVFGYFHTASNPSYKDSTTFRTLSSLFSDYTNPSFDGTIYDDTYVLDWNGSSTLKREGLVLPEQWESLCDLVGFPKASKKMGQIAQSQEIKEAVVAIPFIEHEGERQFFEIPRETIEKAGQLIDGTAMSSFQDQTLEPGGSVVDMIRRMRSYVFPPKMDFLTYEAINPFAMYIFEFSYELNQQDLSDIWQNILPEHGTRMKESTATISHTLMEEELSGQNQQLLGWRAAASGKRIPSNLQWLVFKVKQRGESDYFAKVFGSDAQETSVLQGGIQKKMTTFAALDNSAVLDSSGQSEYSYNWPYDYCSVVELASLETAVSYGTEGITGYDPPAPDYTTPTGELTTVLDGASDLAAQAMVESALNWSDSE